MGSMRRGLWTALAAAACACGRSDAKTPPIDTPSGGASFVSTKGASSSIASASPEASASNADPSEKQAPKPLVVHLVPLGDVSDETLTDTATALRAHAPVDAVIEARRALPAKTMSSEKGRYRSELLLDFLDQLPLTFSTASGDHDKVMGVAAIDIVADKNGNPNWGILGLGALDGRCSVISTYRMKRAFEKGGGAPEPLVHERLWKITLHELGHTLGLSHCPNVGCIMQDGHGTVKTVDAETAFCPSCAKLFADGIEKGNVTPVVE